MPEPEKTLASPEFVVSSDGLDQVVETAAQKLVDAEQADRAAANSRPGGLGNIVKAHHMQEAGLLRKEAELAGSILDMVVERSDSTPWAIVIEAKAHEVIDS